MLLGMRITRQEEQDERRTDFRDQYCLAWAASGGPSQDIVQEVYTAAICEEPLTDIRYHPLWVFITTALKQNVPLNWFGQDNPAIAPPGTPPLDQLQQMVNRFKERLFGKNGKPLAGESSSEDHPAS